MMLFNSRRGWYAAIATIIAFGLAAGTTEPASAQEKPNIVVIWGDDIGVSNISAYHRGMMGGSTPNIDRLAKEGIMFTDYYAQQSCTAGRASFILGQNPFRTGLLTIGMPGSEQGVQAKDPTIAELLKPMGYATAQISKNHLGDRNECLPTVHGFDEFYGNLYHLNAEEEPEDPDYLKDPEFRATFGPRGLLDCVASDTDDPTVDPRWGRVGKQEIKDTGPLTRKRMETVEEDLLKRSLSFIDKSHAAKKTFFLWHNSTRNHVWIRQSDQWKDESGYGIYADGMSELDYVVGELLREERKALDRQIRNDHSKLQAIAANTQIAGNISGLSEIQQRIQTADQRLKTITNEEAALATQEINQPDIQRVLADFDEVWDALPPREQVRVVSLLVETVNFDGAGGNVAITFHPTGLESLTQQPLETAQ